MFELLTWLTGVVIAVATVWVYRRERDPLHPLMFLGPLFTFSYCASPLILFYGQRLDRPFPKPEQLEYVQSVILACMVLFAFGCTRPRARVMGPRPGLRDHFVSVVADSGMAQRMLHFGILLGCVGVLAYVIMISNVGGLVRAYDSPKGGGYAPSGYIGEGPLLVYPAIILVAMSARSRRSEWWHAVLAVLFASPQLVHGILGGRRGPLFLVLATLFFSFFIARGVRPSRKVILAGVLGIGFAVILVWSQRQQMFVGSEMAFDRESVLERFLPKEDEVAGDSYVYGAGVMWNSRYFADYGWGKKYLVNLLVRPIPRQIWPTKYEDTIPTVPKETENQWKRSLGWIPLAGSASGFVADTYTEFGLGCLAVSYLMGLFCGSCWKKSVVEGGAWEIIFIEVLILGIYLPTQSFSAFWYRLLFMAVPTWFVWRHYIIGHRRPVMDEWPSLEVMESRLNQRDATARKNQA